MAVCRSVSVLNCLVVLAVFVLKSLPLVDVAIAGLLVAILHALYTLVCRGWEAQMSVSCVASRLGRQALLAAHLRRSSISFVSSGQVLPEVLLSSVKLLGARSLRLKGLKQEALPCWCSW